VVPVRAHGTSIGRGSAGEYFVSCDSCDFNPGYTPDRRKAEGWAAEHIIHPNRDVSGIWAFDRWQVIGGINHAFPFGTAACGANRPEGRPPDTSFPVCETCESMVEDDVFGSWDWENWLLIDGINHAVPFGLTACGTGNPAILPPDSDLPFCPSCVDLAPSER
jgi:hypothetical protein